MWNRQLVGTFLVLLTSWLIAALAADPQSVGAAGSKSEASSHQPQQQQQQLPGQYSPHSAHSATSYTKLVADNFGQFYPYLQSNKQRDLSAHDATDESQDVGDLRVTSRARAPMFVGKKRTAAYSSAQGDTSFHYGSVLDSQESAEHHVDRRAAPMFVGKRQTAPFFVGKRLYHYAARGAPFFIGKRFRYYRPSGNGASSLPYLSAQEFKETFRRSDPYFMGKRMVQDTDDSAEVTDFEDKRGAPRFVGKRGAPFFVGKRGAPRFVGKRTEDEEVSLEDDKRGAPRFVGKRGAPYFVGKRGAPRFVGKRNIRCFLSKRGAPRFIGKRFFGDGPEEEDFSVSEDKRAAPRFVGRRGAPYFIGKRGAPRFVGKRPDEVDSGEQDLFSFDDKRAAPRFVGKRGDLVCFDDEIDTDFEYDDNLEDKRGAPRFVGKRSEEEEDYFQERKNTKGRFWEFLDLPVGTLEATEGMGDRTRSENQSDNVFDDGSNEEAQRGMNIVHSRTERSSGSPFVEEANSMARPIDEESYLTALKTKNQYGNINGPGFGGFRLKTDSREFYDKEASRNKAAVALLNPKDGKMASETDVSSQRSKRFNEFVGKRGFIGEAETVRGTDGESDELDTDTIKELNYERHGLQDDVMRALMHRIYAALSNEDAMKRQYEFVGKRSYDFIGKKRYDFIGKRHPNYLFAKRYDFIGKRRPYDFLGKKSYDFLGKRYDFIGKRYEFVGKRNQGFQGENEASEAAMLNEAAPHSPPLNLDTFGEESKRYSEFLGKRKRTAEEEEEPTLSDSQRLAVLLQNNGLRKRLSRMLLTQKLAEQYPEFIGK